MNGSAAQPGAPVAPAAMLSDAAAWAAEGAATDAKAAPPPAQPPPGADPAATADLLVTVLDMLIAELAGKRFKLAPEEAAALKAKAAPVVAIYLPPELLMGPLGALAITAAAIYGPKFMQPAAPSTETVDAPPSSAPAA